MSETYAVTGIISVEGTEDDILQRAASVNYLADFSIAGALIEEAKKKGLKPLPAEKFELMPGKGAKALIGGMEIRVGSPKLLVEERLPVPVSFVEKIKALSREGKTVIVVLSGRSLSGAVVLSSEPQSSETKASDEEKETRPLSRTQRFFSFLFRKGG